MQGIDPGKGNALSLQTTQPFLVMDVTLRNEDPSAPQTCTRQFNSPFLTHRLFAHTMPDGEKVTATLRLEDWYQESCVCEMGLQAEGTVITHSA